VRGVDVAGGGVETWRLTLAPLGFSRVARAPCSYAGDIIIEDFVSHYCTKKSHN
jgi:hypothetical protein